MDYEQEMALVTMAQEIDLKYIWKCPICDYEYEDYPNYNEAMPCPTHGGACVKIGESHFG